MCEGAVNATKYRGPRTVKHLVSRGNLGACGSCPACAGASVVSLRRAGACACRGASREAGSRQALPKMRREEPVMTIRTGLSLSVAAIAIVALLGAPPAQVSAQAPAPAAVNIGDSDLGGVVTSQRGPE